MSEQWIKLLDDPEIWKPFFPHVFYIKSKHLIAVKGKLQWHVFDEACPHNGAKLSKGFFNADETLVCPLHRYRFNLMDGRALSGGCALHLYKTQLRQNALFVSI